MNFECELTQYFPKYFNNSRSHMKPASEIEKLIRKMIRDKKGLFLVAESLGNICGFGYVVAYQFKRVSFPDSLMGEFKELWVSKEMRGKRISSRMKDEFFKWFKKKGCKIVIIEVLKTNPAKKVYENWGFESYVETYSKKL